MDQPVPPALDTVLAQLAAKGVELPPGPVRLDDYGDSPEMARSLIGLILEGRKRAGAALLWSFEHECEALPQVGDVGIVLDHEGAPVLVSRVVRVDVRPFDQVDGDYAALEGEGDGSLAYWRAGHWDFFARACAQIGRVPDAAMPVVCTVFEVVAEVPPTARTGLERPSTPAPSSNHGADPGYPTPMTATIDGRRVRLRPAGLADRRMIHDWSYGSDVAPLLHLSDEPSRPFDDWCTDWEEHYFTDAAPDRGRMFVVLDRETPVGAIAHHAIDERRRTELDIWLNAEATCGRGLGTDAVEALCAHLEEALGVRTFMMQPSARNPRAVRAYEKVGFVQVPATAEEIAADWGDVDHPDSVLMLRQVDRP